MGEVVPVIVGLVVGTAFVLVFAVLMNPLNRLPVPLGYVVGENMTQLYSFSSPIYLTKSFGAGDVHIASFGNNLYFTWEASVPLNANERKLGLIAASDEFFARSSDNGMTVHPTISLTNRTIVNDPLIVADGSNVYLVWTASGRYERISYTYDDIFFRTSKDNGATFSPTTNLSGNVGTPQHPQMAVSGKNVYVLWDDYTTRKGQILLRVSNDGGNTFSRLIRLSSDTESSLAPQIAVSGNNVYAVWYDLEPEARIVFRASEDNGTTFGNPINLRTVHTGASCCPKITASGNNVYVIWADTKLDGLLSGHYDLDFRASHDGGVTFSPIINLSNVARDYKIAESGKNVYVAWTDVLRINSTIENAEVFFSRSTNNGASFDIPINLSNNVGASSNSQIAVSDQNVYIAWVDRTLGNDEIFFRGSDDNGSSFGRTINLSNSAGISSDPQIVVAQKKVYIVWVEFGDASHNKGIYFVRSSD